MINWCVRLVVVGWCLASLAFAKEASLEEVPAELNLRGSVQGMRPMIVLYEPVLPAGSVWLDKLSSLTEVGSHLTQHKGGSLAAVLPLLRAADYRVIEIEALSWREGFLRAEAQIILNQPPVAARQNPRANLRRPVCVYLRAQASVGDLSLLARRRVAGHELSIIHPFVGGQSGRDVVLFWPRMFRPNYTSDFACTDASWITTFAAIVDTLPPASNRGASLLPVLTGSGYPMVLPTVALRELPALGDQPLPAQVAQTPLYEVKRFDRIKYHQWVPDLSGVLPTRRLYQKQLPIKIFDLPKLKQQSKDLCGWVISGHIAVAKTGVVTFELPAGLRAYWRLQQLPIFEDALPMRTSPVSREVPMEAGLHAFELTIVVDAKQDAWGVPKVNGQPLLAWPIVPKSVR